MGDGHLVTHSNEEPRAWDLALVRNSITLFTRTTSTELPSIELPSRNSLGGTPFCRTYLSGNPSMELLFAELPRQNPLLSNSLGGTLFDRLEIRKLWRFLLGGLEVSKLVDIGKFDHPQTFCITPLSIPKLLYA
ncbi:unnamed protein product [Prunus armeniaca]|uniref:Uncharacterized protein n=1 Tax=Prunus armeniaca TaxID=36596 RepID=A0A6J5UE60_PRUAR|nr:unnamed protein product [Prunus armeniaca]